jgi:hypothetical protein
MGNTDSVVFALWSLFFNGVVIWLVKDAKPVFFRFALLLFMFYFMQSNVLTLSKLLGYEFQITAPTQISVSIFLAWFTTLLDQNRRTTGSSRQRTYLVVVTEMLQGDQNAAVRLFNYNKDKFGGKTDEWIWQKVIRDIERDRR